MEPLTYNWAGTTEIGVNPPGNQVLSRVSRELRVYRAVEPTLPRGSCWAFDANLFPLLIVFILVEETLQDRAKVRSRYRAERANSLT